MSDPTNNTQPATPAPGTPEHEATMASKFDTAQSGNPPADPPAETPAEPELILGKFKSQDDLAKAYQELEAKVGKPKEEAPAEPSGDTNDAARETVEKAGLDFDSMSAEFNANGSLSEATYEALDKAGIPKEVVDQYIAGQDALRNGLQMAAYLEAGGEDSYSAMVQWATVNMTDAEIDAYNRAVNSNKADVIRLAVAGLKGRYEAANGAEPNLATGELGSVTGPAFESWAQVREAMRDPRYAKDPAYRRDVEQKLARSNPI